jgi:predicted amidohydrolase YtcJ
MRAAIPIYALLCILILNLACKPERQPADLIINGTIYTVDDKQPVVEAVAVTGDKIIFAGSATEALKFRNDKTRIIDLKGRIMTPGFIEGHAHIMAIGYNEMNLDLQNVTSYEEIVKKVEEAVQKAKPGEWILGRGWHQDKWDHKPAKIVKGFQTHHLLSKISPNNPVYLEHASGHAGIANARAMEIAGVNILSIEKLKKDVVDQGGEIIRDDLGNPTGIFTENAMDLIEEKIPVNNPETDRKALELALQACLRNGITSFHDAGADRVAIDLFYTFKKEGNLPVRMYVMIEGDSTFLNEWYKKGPDIDKSHWLTIRSIKLHCDGALGSRGAWLLEPYSDRPGFYGMATLSMDTVLKVSKNGLKYGFQVCSHAIGDRTNREVLNCYETAFKENPASAKDHRYRIEHAQHLHPDDLPRFAKLGVIASMQAIHMSSDRPWAINRLGEKRITEGAYMWQSLLKAGARIVNGTDAPIEPLNPIACFYASITRKTLQGEPEGGYEPKEKMTREQALRSYTLDAAYAAFEENIKGSIEEGKLADFTIFSADLMNLPEDQILHTSVEMTIVGGKVQYEKK